LGEINAPKSPSLGTSNPSLTPPELGAGGRSPELGAGGDLQNWGRGAISRIGGGGRSPKLGDGGRSPELEAGRLSQVGCFFHKIFPN